MLDPVSGQARALFLDRDGVLVRNRASYIRSWNDVEFLPGAFEALRIAASSPFKVIIVTNQSAVGRGIITLATAENICDAIVERFQKEGGKVDAVYMCPHDPADRCECRKPQPGLIRKAAREFSIDLSESVLIGDAITDLRAGWAAGIRDVILVETGRGKDQVALATEAERTRFSVQSSLLPAIRAALAGPG